MSNTQSANEPLATCGGTAHPHRYRIRLRLRGFEPQMRYHTGMTGKNFWTPLTPEGYWAEPDSYSYGSVKGTYPLTLRMARQAIVRAKRINGAGLLQIVPNESSSPTAAGGSGGARGSAATLELAIRFCVAHRDTYEDLLNSDSADVDPDFMNLCHAVFGPPVNVNGKWQPNDPSSGAA